MSDSEIHVLDPAAIEADRDPLGVGAGDAPPGTYALVYSLRKAATLPVGALGRAAFPAGAYAYVGSAFGSNGLGRIDRHRRVAAGDHDVTHWHVDYLGAHPETSLTSVLAAPDADVECALASELLGTDSARAPPLAGFGASDCDCPAHLVAGADGDGLRSAVRSAFEAVSE
ncbi:GIY-YIG nuclease family protein [Halobellus sp. EA9]|uniref:GIY-YIG nuclease family protein n=1 Tax=Halobellus sp. EA9 TaxID=3421647 RepID=UPI003EB8DE2B